MSDLHVEPKVLVTSGEKVKVNVEMMKDALDRANTIMERTYDSYAATSGETLRNEFSTLRPNFVKFYELGMRYSDLLINSGNRYMTSEANRTKAANDLLKS